MSDNNGDSNPSKSKKGPPEKPSASADPPPIASDQRKRDETETIDASQPVIDGKKRSLIGRVQIGSVIIVWDNGEHGLSCEHAGQRLMFLNVDPL